MKELSIGSMILAVVLVLLLVLIVIPSIFDHMKQLWYLKHGSGIVKHGMYYDSKKGSIEASNEEKI